MHLDGLNAEHKFEYGSPYLATRHFKKKNIFLFFSSQFCTLGLYVKSNVVMLFCANFICFALFYLLHILLFISLFLPNICSCVVLLLV